MLAEKYYLRSRMELNEEKMNRPPLISSRHIFVYRQAISNTKVNKKIK